VLNNYHDSHLERVALGPRRELTLFIELDRQANRSIANNAVVRFGTIANYEEVEAFFSTMRDPGGPYLADVSRLEQQQKDSWLLGFTGYGEIRVRSARCTEQKR